MFAADYRFQDHVFDLFEKQGVVMAHQLQSLAEGGETPLRSLAIILCVSVLLEIRVVLVETVVGQVDILLLLEVAEDAECVLLGGKSGQTIFIDVHSQRVY